MTTTDHDHRFVAFHADYCHRYESGEICECGETRHVCAHLRDFGSLDSAWWHWGRARCVDCDSLMREAGLDPRALADEDVACSEMQRKG